MQGHQDLTDLYCGLPLMTPDSTRVISIKPGIFNAPMDLRLKVISLDLKPKYEALSYTWGGSREKNTVSVNGFEMPITDNLFRALRRLRKKIFTRVIWIDAICINQANPEERSQQVAIMDRIYSTANSVEVWLGEVDVKAEFHLKELLGRIRYLWEASFPPTASYLVAIAIFATPHSERRLERCTLHALSRTKRRHCMV
jgi:hypothetical protein